MELIVKLLTQILKFIKIRFIIVHVIYIDNSTLIER
jgi:hypothetical protein